MKKKKPESNYFCWEKSNGRWSPRLYHGEIPEYANTNRFRHAAKDSDIIRTEMKEVPVDLSLSECINLHPMRHE